MSGTAEILLTNESKTCYQRKILGHNMREESSRTNTEEIWKYRKLTYHSSTIDFSCTKRQNILALVKDVIDLYYFLLSDISKVLE